jgi:hypothetical protein
MMFVVLPTNSKCYKLYEDALNYADADAVCRSVGYGSLGTLLIQLEDYSELEVMKKICRGDEYVMLIRYFFVVWACLPRLSMPQLMCNDIASLDACYIL